MRRRAFLGLVAGAATGGAGCTANALPSPPRQDEGVPADCPTVPDVERTVCTSADGPVSVERSSASVSGDAWSLVVAVRNRGDGPIGLDPYGWSVLGGADGGWTPVAPAAYSGPWRELVPGARYAWRLTAGGDGLAAVDQEVFLDLSVGPYAFAVRVRAGGLLGAVATFEVTG